MHCLYKKFPKFEHDQIIKLGENKKRNLGYTYGNSLIIERDARDWDAQHAYGIPVNRRELKENDYLLNKLSKIRHKNIMKIYSFCECAVEVEYIDGWIFNSHKPSYILFERAYQKDFLSLCTEEELYRSLKKIFEALCTLHSHKILHTDLTDFNVLVKKSTFEPVVIDLLGAIRIGQQTFNIKEDVQVFVHHFLIPTLTRLNILRASEISKMFKDYSYNEVIDFLENRI
ncbi:MULTISPECIES: RIO1 family regulatory kinase/ATPase [unclassified Planococcus (in: firmicutes)]|uniref:protein kinase domain-containing protein n=1 Tax=unclassified Planococcus (in: firmicutes) TaxID=2662419 RepID=UPI0015E11FD7|nr:MULTISPECIES: RIO1 family regulatory kinase/ATPase [unclassified Planococcus (in: firmicutes)]